MKEKLGADRERAANDLTVIGLTLEHLEQTTRLPARERDMVRVAIGRTRRLAGYLRSRRSVKRLTPGL